MDGALVGVGLHNSSIPGYGEIQTTCVQVTHNCSDNVGGKYGGQLILYYIKNWENFFSVCVGQLALVNISAATTEDAPYTEAKVFKKKE